MPQLIASANSGGSSGLTKSDAAWATARNAASADSENTSQLGPRGSDLGATFSITRGTLPILLTSLPKGATVTSASLSVTYSDLGGGVTDNDTTDVDVVLLSSMGDETNAAVGDYNKFGTAVGGSISLADVSANGEGAQVITLNSTAFGWIEAAAGNWLRLGIRNSRDTDNATPTGENRIDTITAAGTITINYTLLDDIVGLYLA